LQRAKNEGVIDDFFIEPQQEFFNVDLIIFGVPISAINKLLEKFIGFFPENVLITDVLSTKQSVALLFDKYNLNFVGSHPMAGSEKASYDYASADLFKNKRCIVCPSPNVKIESVERIKNFWKILEMQVSTTSPETHDELVAITSHFIHILSFAYVLFLKEKNIDVKNFIGTSFEEFSRLAGSSPEIWSDIFIDNIDKINFVSKDIINTLQDFLDFLNKSDKDDIIKKLNEINEFKGKLK